MVNEVNQNMHCVPAIKWTQVKNTADLTATALSGHCIKYISEEQQTQFGSNTYFVNMKGMRWARCSASDDGPLPVYR